MHADEELASIPVPRSLVERRAYARDRLESGFQMWLATGSDGHGAHLIPVAYVWDGSALYTATFAKSRTVANIKARPQARVALGTTADVVMIDTGASLMDVPDIEPDIAERYARVSTDPAPTRRARSSTYACNLGASWSGTAFTNSLGARLCGTADGLIIRSTEVTSGCPGSMVPRRGNAESDRHRVSACSGSAVCEGMHGACAQRTRSLPHEGAGWVASRANCPLRR